MADAALTIGITTGITGATAAMKLEACKQIPDINPYKECISSCTNYKNNKEDYAKCINENRCNDVDLDTNEKINININLRDKCKKDALSNESMEYDMLAIMITKELIEGVLINTLAYKLGSKQLLTKSTRQFAKQFTKKAAKVAIKTGTKMVAKEGTKKGSTILAKTIAKTANKIITNTIGTKLAAAAFRLMLKSLAIGLGVMSVLDGVSIALDVWDPAGFAVVPTSKDIKEIRDSYINSNKSEIDNKMWNSELYKSQKHEVEQEYELYKSIYSIEKTDKAKEAMNDSKKKLDEINKLNTSIKFRGSERPIQHGGIISFPFEAFPNYPFNDDGEFMNGKLEEHYCKFFREYVTNQGNLVWTDTELNELIEIQREKDTIEKKKNNLANKSNSNLQEDIKEDLEKSQILKNKIKVKEKKIEEMIKNGGLSEQIEEDKKKLEELKKIKSNVDENINTSESIISGAMSRNELLQQQSAITTEIPIHQNKLSLKTVFFIIGCMCLVVLYIYIY